MKEKLLFYKRKNSTKYKRLCCVNCISYLYTAVEFTVSVKDVTTTECHSQFTIFGGWSSSECMLSIEISTFDK